jgi:hypothetical protein
MLSSRSETPDGLRRAARNSIDAVETNLLLQTAKMLCFFLKSEHSATPPRPTAHWNKFQCHPRLGKREMIGNSGLGDKKMADNKMGGSRNRELLLLMR